MDEALVIAFFFMRITIAPFHSFLGEASMNRAYLLLITAALALSACGTTTKDRAIGGAAVGAGTGAVIGSMVGATGEGALIGAGVGATVGAVTDSDHINLGKPWWK